MSMLPNARQTIMTRDNGSRRVVSLTPDKSRTKQSERDATNINKIVAKYRKTGLIEHVAKHQGVYMDVSNITDLQDAMHKVQAAEEAFMSLPANIRKHFDNDPARFVDEVQDPARAEEMQELGLLPKPKRATEPVPGATEGGEGDGEGGSQTE